MPSLSSNELSLLITATDKASGDLDSLKKKIKELGDETENSNGKASGLSSGMEKLKGVGKGVALAVGGAAIAAGTLAAVGLGSMITYSFNATREVQKYVAGIKGLTSNSAEASDVIKSMVDYVQGKPFDRIEVLGAARNLLVFGRNAAETKSDIELLGRAVVVSGSSFEDLSQIYGRVASSGRLMTDDFNQLMYAGVNVGKTLTNNLGISMDELRKRLEKGDISFEDFRKAMEDALPADVVKEASNTIDNKIQTLQASFRNLGFEILGVDFSKLDSKGQPLVKSGGLLDKLIDGFTAVSDYLKSPAIKGAFESYGEYVVKSLDKMKELGDTAAAYLAPKIQRLASAFSESMPTILAFKRDVIDPLAYALGVVIVVAVGILIDALKVLIGWLAGAYQAVKGSLGKLRETLQPGFDWFLQYIWPALQGFAAWIANEFKAAWEEFKKVWDNVADAFEKAGIKIDGVQLLLLILVGILAILLAPVIVVLGVILALALAFAEVIRFVSWLNNVIFDFVNGAVAKVWEFAVKVANFLLSVKRDFEDLCDGVSRAWNFITTLDWGKALGFIARAVGNTIISMIEGAINGAISGLPGSPKVHIPRFARGTNFAPGGLALVGEEGPELVNLPRGSKVSTAAETRQTLSQGGSGSNVYVTQNIYNQMDYDKSFAELGFRLRAA